MFKNMNKSKNNLKCNQQLVLRIRNNFHLCTSERGSLEIGTSGGKMRVSFQFMTLRYVSWGLSEQNGG